MGLYKYVVYFRQGGHCHKQHDYHTFRWSNLQPFESIPWFVGHSAYRKILYQTRLSTHWPVRHLFATHVSTRYFQRYVYLLFPCRTIPISWPNHNSNMSDSRQSYHYCTSYLIAHYVVVFPLDFQLLAFPCEQLLLTFCVSLRSNSLVR